MCFVLSVGLAASAESRLCLAFPLPILKILILLYLCVCLFGGSNRGQKEASDPWKLDLQVLESHLMRAMGSELGSSNRAVSVFN